jgi:energy-coupling factor transporter ATP-binding protein EcfA2
VRVFNRAAPDGAGGYVIDIGNETGTAVFVGAQGWAVKPQSTVAFRRGQGYGALAVPNAAERPAEAWGRVYSWLAGCGVREKWIPAVIVMLVDWFRPDTPNPIAELVGAAGSGKSTLAARLARLIDPTTSGGLASVEITEPGIGAAAMNRYVLAHDNAGGPLKEAQQDLLCKVSTGGTLAARRLYTQDEEFQVDVRSPFILTAIIPVITRADARSRTLRIKVSKREEFSGAVGVDADFENQRGVLTGALLSLLASGLAGLDQARRQKYLHRLVDFEQLGEAITAAVGWTPGEFQALMREHRKSAAEEAAESIPVVVAVLKVIEKFGAQATGEKQPITENGVEVGYVYLGDNGSLTVGVRLRRLHEESIHARGSGLSTGEKATANALTVHEPTLEALGITVAGRRKMKSGVLVELSTRAAEAWAR